MGGHSWVAKIDNIDDVLASHVNDLQNKKSDNKDGIIEKTDDYVLIVADMKNDSIFIMNAAIAKTFTLPSVGASDIGIDCILAKVGAGKLTIQAADNDTIHDSSAGGTLYNDLAAEVYAVVRLILVQETKWIIVGISGTGWITT